MTDRATGMRAIRAGQLALVCSGAALWAASRMPWVQIRSADGLGQPRELTVSGAQWSTALVPLAALMVATALVLLAVRGAMLRVVAVLVALVSAATGYLAISQWVLPDVSARAAILMEVPIVSLVASERYFGGAIVVLVAAVMALAAAVLLLRSAAAGPVARYAAPNSRRSAPAKATAPTTSEREMWDALDGGDDPTDPVEPGEGR